MATVKWDILKGSNGERDWQGWRILERIAIVSGMVSEGWVNKVNEALGAAGVVIGESVHPNATYCYLSKVRPILLSTGDVKLSLVYERYEAGEKEETVGASLVSGETNVDKNGDEISLEYVYPIGYIKDSSTTALTHTVTATQGKLVSKLVPQASVSITKNTSNPLDDARNFVGKVNSSSWNGGGAKEWLCTSIWGKRVKAFQYRTTYSAQYNPDGWGTDVVFMRDNGTPPPTTDSDSKKTIDVYQEANFGNLGI